MPDGVADRNADVWEPLLVVADVAGGAWPERARVSCVTHVTLSKAAIPSLGVRLLADLRTVFGEREQMFTQEILDALVALDDAPWNDLHGKPLNPRGLSQRLAKYGVERHTVRVGPLTGKGYSRADLADPWCRYVTQLPLEPIGEPGGEREGERETNGLGTPAYRKGTSVTSVTSVTKPKGPEGPFPLAELLLAADESIRLWVDKPNGHSRPDAGRSALHWPAALTAHGSDVEVAG